MSAIAPANILSQKSNLVSGKLKVTKHYFEVPKDYAKPNDGTIKIFARSARKHNSFPDEAKNKDQLPWMCFLNGGPGCECRPPQDYAWTRTILLEKGYQLLYLDQRGTGFSKRVTPSTVQTQGSVEEQAKLLKLYRADSIVKDCEAIRQALTADYPDEKKKWSIMGQSFGGFCTITYLSFFPQGLRESFLFGGLQPLIKSPDPAYRALSRKVIERNEAYYTKHPEDVDLVRNILAYLQRSGDGSVKLPSGGALTPRRFQQLGFHFGMHGGLDYVNNIVASASSDIEDFGYLTEATLGAVERAMPFDAENLIYSILHEPIYCEGQAPNWSASRVVSGISEFSFDRQDRRVYFTGEMVFPWMFDEDPRLRKVKEVANRIASDPDWPTLFDEEQLAKNEVPVYAAAYVDDMYVDFDLSMETARKIKGCKVFTTNVMFHDAIRSRMDDVVRQAFQLRDDVLD